MKQWSVSDLIDLEYFFARDEAQPEMLLEERDREIYLRTVSPHLQETSPGSRSFRRNALGLWLDERRGLYQKDHGTQAVLPGDVFTEALGLLGFVIAVIGIASGVGLALSMLVYGGQEPINVSVYFGVLVLMQILFIMVTLRFFFIRTSTGRLKRYSVVYPLLGTLLTRMVNRLFQSAIRRFSAEHKQGMEAFFGRALGRHTLYGPVLFWTLFGLVQTFGVFFNLGAIAATLIRVFTADLAFGWQSTLQVSSQAVYSLVRVLAVPWAWVVSPGIAYPGLAQIEGSRMVLKDGIYHLMTSDLVAWWPFLVCAVCFYGLLPRLILFLAALAGRRHCLSLVDFTAADAERLLLRMTRPVLSTAGSAEHHQGAAMNGEPGGAAIAEAVRAQGISSIVLVPADLAPLYDALELKETVSRSLGWDIAEVREIQGEAHADEQVIGAAADAFAAGDRGVVVLLEAWQPPIVETMEFIKALRVSLGKTARLAVLLIGRPDGRTIFTGVDASDREMWARSIHRLADPYLRLEAAGGSG